jgi:hypothetical protein
MDEMLRPGYHDISLDVGKAGITRPTEAVSISAMVGGLPRGPFLVINANRRRQYLAITSTLPSC